MSRCYTSVERPIGWRVESAGCVKVPESVSEWEPGFFHEARWPGVEPALGLRVTGYTHQSSTPTLNHARPLWDAYLVTHSAQILRHMAFNSSLKVKLNVNRFVSCSLILFLSPQKWFLSNLDTFPFSDQSVDQRSLAIAFD
jgi:hypothetical protein